MADDNLGKLLAILQQRAETEVTRVTYHGRAVSRSDQYLHLATEEGLLAIPLEEIECVGTFVKDRPDMVFVGVRNATLVRNLLRADELPQPPWQGPLPWPGGGLGPLGPTDPRGTAKEWEVVCTDTTTKSGCPPTADATDDQRCHNVPSW